MDDLISRQMVLDILNDFSNRPVQTVKGIIAKLPSVTLQQSKGHWILKGHNLGDDYIDEKYCCSKCGERALVYEFGTHPVCLSKFCPNCGVRMVGDENGFT